jgi:Recombination endonuclease VII
MQGGARVTVMDDLKRCSGCKELKLLSEFNNRAKAKDGRQAYCRACNSRAMIRHNPQNNPITKAKINAIKYGMLEHQGGKCAICGEVPTKPHADHDHSCPKHKGGQASFYARCPCARGVLCHTCNTKLMALVDAGRIPPTPEVQHYLDNPPAQSYFTLLEEWEAA